jgi:maleate isomerase
MNLKRIALIIPHTDTTLETDFQSFLPDQYILHTQRIWLDEVGEESEKRMVDEDLPRGLIYLKGIAEYDGVVFGCTSASAVYGKEGLSRLEKYLSEEFNCKSISAFGAILEDLKKINASSVGLITPYTESVNDFMVKSMGEFNINISFEAGFGLSDDCEISKIKPEEIIGFIKKHSEDINKNCDALLISCTNFRAMEIREEIEQILGIKVITSNYSICNWLTSDRNSY